jgi:hypothetical protein
MKIFIICCILFIHVSMCIFIRGFRVSVGLVLVMDFHPNRYSVRVRVSTLGFGFGCTETPPDPNPTRCHPYARRSTGSTVHHHGDHIVERDHRAAEQWQRHVNAIPEVTCDESKLLMRRAAVLFCLSSSRVGW